MGPHRERRRRQRPGQPPLKPFMPKIMRLQPCAGRSPRRRGARTDRESLDDAHSSPQRPRPNQRQTRISPPHGKYRNHPDARMPQLMSAKSSQQPRGAARSRGARKCPEDQHDADAHKSLEELHDAERPTKALRSSVKSRGPQKPRGDPRSRGAHKSHEEPQEVEGPSKAKRSEGNPGESLGWKIPIFIIES